MAGSYDLFDAQAITGPTEYDSRYGTKIDTLQIHHATMTSISGLISLMAPGGRQVSANGAMGNDGGLYEVVPASERAFTSATEYDRRSLTVECCNTTVDANWGISDATHRRLGKLAAQMFQKGLLGGINRSYIIGHNEVPGTYATACPGPSMNLDLVVQYAREFLNPPRKGAPPMSTLFDVLDDSQDRDFLLGDGGKISPVPNSDKAALRLWWKGVSGGKPVDVYYGDLLKIGKQISLANPATSTSSGPVTVNGPTPAEIAKAVNDDAAARLKA